jgi:hypothetical protein
MEHLSNLLMFHVVVAENLLIAVPGLEKLANSLEVRGRARHRAASSGQVKD